MLNPKMKFFVCPDCGEFEEVVAGLDTTTECPKCGKESPLLQDWNKQAFRKGAHDRHVSWSQWNAGD